MPSKLSQGNQTVLGPEGKLTNGIAANPDLSKRGPGLTRGPSMLAKSNSAAWTNVWPADGATLDLDFSNDRGFVRGVGQGKSMDAVSFTRASSGCFVGSDGLLKQYSSYGALGNNILPFPQDFDNAAWQKQSVTIAKGVQAPDGTNTGFTLLANSGNNFSGVNTTGIAIPANTTYCFSMYLKYINNRYAILGATNQNSSSWFAITVDLINGTITQTSNGANGVVVSSSISSSSNGWFRVVISGYTTDTFNWFPKVLFSDVSNPSIPGYLNYSYTKTGNEELSIWGAQLELGSSATTYYPTNINTPRFDWASTTQVANNLFTYTESFDNTSGWTKSGVTVVADSTTAPDGTNTADLMYPTTTGFQYLRQVPALSSGFTYTVSVYAKAGGKNWLELKGYNSLNPTFPTAYFDLVNGVLGNTSGNPNATITSVGSGWYRCSITVNSTGTDGYFRFVAADGNGNENSTTSGTNGIYLWGAQLEIGSTPTAYKQVQGGFPAANTPLSANTTCNGLLIEESRANALLWCRDATNAAYVKTNITAAKNQTGIDGVANAASSLTATNANGTCIQTVTAASASKTCSVYLKRITGTGTIQVTADGSTWSTVDLSNDLWNRIVLSGTITNPTVGIKIVTSGDAVAMDFGQIEAGTFVTSPIMTTTASVTRSQDVQSILASSAWFNQQAGTWYVEYNIYANSLGPGRLIGQGSGSSGFFRCSVNADVGAYDNKTNSVAISNYSYVANTFVRAVGTYNQQVFAISANGSLYSSAQPIGIGANGLLYTNYISIGSSNLSTNSQVVTGLIKRIFYVPAFMNQTQLSVMSKP